MGDLKRPKFCHGQVEMTRLVVSHQGWAREGSLGASGGKTKPNHDTGGPNRRHSKPAPSLRSPRRSCLRKKASADKCLE
jgi:hypothetical protein